MYTDEMKRAFNSIPKPNNKFRMEVLDNEHFLVLRLDTASLRGMTGEQMKESIIYALKVKTALESAGAVVLVTREADNAT
jgi:hypothetical protein